MKISTSGLEPNPFRLKNSKYPPKKNNKSPSAIPEHRSDYNIKNISGKQNKYRLENDPGCGLTTGGRAECWWNCYQYVIFVLPPACLSDCYPADHCLSALIAEYQAVGGVCRGSYLDIVYNGVFNVSDQHCDVDVASTNVVKGLCSNRTQELLRDQGNCVIPVWNQKEYILNTARDLIGSMFGQQTLENFRPSSLGRRLNTDDATNNNERLIPVEYVYDYYRYDYDTLEVDPDSVRIARVPPLENTKHRYPWICSLRSLGQQSSHICGVTLLSRPPGPTVLVTSAHCVYICKSEDGRLVPNCCCPNVGPGLCTDTEDCGTNPTTVEMTGAEAEVKCGEWDTATDTEEDYNIILPIEKITVHPDFQISRGEQNSQFVANDIAVIKVADRNFEEQSRTHNIYPACLPSPYNNLQDTEAVHSGWSKPPPLDYVTNNAPLHEEYLREFFKQWHYSMNITKCEDPKNYLNSETLLTYPSNSYYPPGTVCAVERLGEFCPTSGESGSPLMVTDQEGRMVAEGINSFIKVLIFL